MCERGATLIEYGLICSLIVVAIMVALTTFAGRAVGLISGVANAVVNAG